MPFADARYPRAASRQVSTYTGLTAHVVQLTNGERLLVEESEDGLSLAVCVRNSDAPDLWVCRIEDAGVMALTYSDDACSRLARRSCA